MSTKEILHRILQGMDQYLSCGVPDPYWELAIELTREIYGCPGVALIENVHHVYEDAIDARHTINLHTLKIDPLALIQGLESLPVWSRA